MERRWILSGTRKPKHHSSNSGLPSSADWPDQSIGCLDFAWPRRLTDSYDVDYQESILGLHSIHHPRQRIRKYPKITEQQSVLVQTTWILGYTSIFLSCRMVSTTMSAPPAVAENPSILDLKDGYGMLLIGVFLSCILYGVSCLQTWAFPYYVHSDDLMALWQLHLLLSVCRFLNLVSICPDVRVLYIVITIPTPGGGGRVL